MNVALNFAGNPVLPPVVSAGPSLSVYGRAWHSYRVEVRDTRLMGNPWRLFTRVAQTNDLQVIAGPPNSWQAFRVDELVADPPLLDLRGAGPQSAFLILFGPTNRSYQVQTADGLRGLPGDWVSWGSSTGPMTNTFRLLPSFPLTEGKQFFRAKQD